MLVGITGGISTGKTFVLNYLKSKNFKTISCDKINKRLLKEGNANYKIILKFFGNNILLNNNKIDKKKLKNFIFNDLNVRQKIEKKLHKNIINEIILKYKKNKITFVEMPLLFEGKFENLFDKIILVCCSKKIQLERLKRRDKIDDREAKKIINLQFSQNKKKEKSDFVINSSYSKKKVINIIEKIIKKIKVGI